MKLSRSRDDPGKGSYWCLSNNMVSDCDSSNQTGKKQNQMTAFNEASRDGSLTPLAHSPSDSPCGAVPPNCSPSAFNPSETLSTSGHPRRSCRNTRQSSQMMPIIDSNDYAPASYTTVASPNLDAAFGPRTLPSIGTLDQTDSSSMSSGSFGEHTSRGGHSLMTADSISDGRVDLSLHDDAPQHILGTTTNVSTPHRNSSHIYYHTSMPSDNVTYSTPDESFHSKRCLDYSTMMEKSVSDGLENTRVSERFIRGNAIHPMSNSTAPVGREFYLPMPNSEPTTDTPMKQPNALDDASMRQSHLDYELDLPSSIRQLYHTLFGSTDHMYAQNHPSLCTEVGCTDLHPGGSRDSGTPNSTPSLTDVTNTCANTPENVLDAPGTRVGSGLLSLGRLLLAPTGAGLLTDQSNHRASNTHSQALSELGFVLQRSLQTASHFDWNSVNLDEFSDLTLKIRAATSMDPTRLTTENLRELHTSLENAFHCITHGPRLQPIQSTRALPLMSVQSPTISTFDAVGALSMDHLSQLTEASSMRGNPSGNCVGQSHLSVLGDQREVGSDGGDANESMMYATLNRTFNLGVDNMGVSRGMVQESEQSRQHQQHEQLMYGKGSGSFTLDSHLPATREHKSVLWDLGNIARMNESAHALHSSASYFTPVPTETSHMDTSSGSCTSLHATPSPSMMCSSGGGGGGGGGELGATAANSHTQPLAFHVDCQTAHSFHLLQCSTNSNTSPTSLQLDSQTQSPSDLYRPMGLWRHITYCPDTVGHDTADILSGGLMPSNKRLPPHTPLHFHQMDQMTTHQSSLDYALLSDASGETCDANPMRISNVMDPFYGKSSTSGLPTHVPRMSHPIVGTRFYPRHCQPLTGSSIVGGAMDEFNWDSLV